MTQLDFFEENGPFVGPWSELYDEPFVPVLSLRTARRQLAELVDEGVHCPCCGQFAKVYRRKIHTSMARALIGLYRAHRELGQVWIEISRTMTIHQWSDAHKLRYWRLIEGDPEREGWWRITNAGVEFVLDRTRVPKYVRLYDGIFLRFEGEQVTIRDCLAMRFDYDELMLGL